MAKRFTDSDKWDKMWFMELPSKYKLLWQYMLDNCDHAGIWSPNLRLAEFQIGEDFTEAEISLHFMQTGRVHYVGEVPQKWFIKAFVQFQYGPLNPANRVHISVISRLEGLGAIKHLTSPLQGAKDKDKDKDLDTDKDKDKDKSPRKRKTYNYSPEFQTFWKAYPRSEDKPGAWAEWQRLIAAGDDPTHITAGIAISDQTTGDPKFIPWAIRWLKRRGFDDEPLAAAPIPIADIPVHLRPVDEFDPKTKKILDDIHHSHERDGVR